MPTAPTFSENLLDPISAEQPAGTDLRWTAEWDRIKEARRADDGLESGKWTKKERKTADWPAVRDLATTILRDRSKDLQVALWLTEANIKLHGFPGLRDGFRIARDLMCRYWDSGLFPAMEDGADDRAGPFDWLNNKLVDSICAIPITARKDGGSDYSYLDVLDARRVGTEANCRNADGDVDSARKKQFDQAVAEGHVTMDMFERAVKETGRAAYEELSADFQQCEEEFRALEKIIDEKFGESAPNMADCRGALRDMAQEIARILERKRADEPDTPAPIGQATTAEAQSELIGPSVQAAQSIVVRLPLSLGQAVGASWQEAEALVRGGEVDQGLALMARLATAETTGRSRFQRKMLLADACLASKRERLARLVLEELAEQIEYHHLESWESSELIGGVWTRLCQLYTDGDDRDRAGKLYERLCRLDPWQALACNVRL